MRFLLYIKHVLEGDVLVVFSPSSCQAEWEKVFSDVSLLLVAVRKSFCGSALFLCRSQPAVKQPIFLPVDSPDYNWVETLKVGSLLFQDTTYPCFKMYHNMYFKTLIESQYTVSL